MKKSNIATFVVTTLIACSSFAKSPTTLWTSDVVEDYQNPKKASTVVQLTDNDGSRWYYTARIKGGFDSIYGSGLAQKDHTALEGNLRIRGLTKLNNDVGIVGDFWLKGKENYTEKDHHVIDSYNGGDDKVTWEQYRLGLENDQLGALLYAKYTATMGVFTTDMGTQGLNDTQGDAGGKNAEKLIYKNQFDNNLFINATYDLRSDIVGADIGYQTADMYSFIPNAYGVYLSAHNGQPMLENGAGKYLIGNIDVTSSTKNSDTNFARAHSDLLTYTLSGYKFFDLRGKLVGNISYSEMDSGETAEKIATRGYTTGGLGYSATVGYQIIPEGFKGFAPILIASYDQYGETLAPQLEYWFKPSLRTWISHAFNSSGQDMTKLEFQWDF